MMIFITLLLAVVSSSKLTYHKFDESRGFCWVMVYEESDCSLKNYLAKHGFNEGACPKSREIECNAASKDELKILAAAWKFNFASECEMDFDVVDLDYKCVQQRNMETYHMESEGCAYIEFDVDKCSGLKEALTDDSFSSGSCPSMYTKSNCDGTEVESPDFMPAKLSLAATGADCLVDEDFTYTFACEGRMKTFHKIDESNGICVYVDYDRFQCTDLTNVLKNDPAFVPGSCPSTHTKDHCDSTTRSEMDFVRAAGTLIYSIHCDLDFDDVYYGYACEEGRGAPKCPAECAKAIAEDASTAFDKENGIEGTGFCSTIMTELEQGKKHVFPDACSELGEMTLGYCMTELYEKCVKGSDELLCPIPDYGLPPVLKDCEPKTCGEWKEAVDTGCLKEVSACIKDELQGNLECTKYGKDLKRPSQAPCGETKACSKAGEFCLFDDASEGKCEMCSHQLCAHLENEKAKADCVKRCGEDDCTSDIGCDDTCETFPLTCKQLKNTMESPTGCGKTCNQCYVDTLNANLECKGADKVQSRIDGDSASALSILMLAIVCIFFGI